LLQSTNKKYEMIQYWHSISTIQP